MRVGSWVPARARGLVGVLVDLGGGLESLTGAMTGGPGPGRSSA